MSNLFFDKVDEIDHVIHVGSDKFDIIRDHLTDTQLHFYFFTNADAKWLGFLRTEGYFTPPEETLPFWPRLEYLERVAPQLPERVCDILQELTANVLTDNFYNFTKVLLALPHSSVAQLSPKLVEVVTSTPRLYATHLESEIITNIARGDNVRGAIDVLTSYLDVSPSMEVSMTEGNTDNSYTPSPTPAPRIDSWEYKEILEKAVPQLLDLEPDGTFITLCDLLEKAVRYSLREPEKQVGEDYSIIWMPLVSVGDEEYGIRELLTISVRDATKNIVATGNQESSSVIAHLMQRKWSVFRRIALYVLSVHANNLELVTAQLLAPENFDDYRVAPEYKLLLASAFPLLQPKERELFLQRIKLGPDVTEITETAKARFPERDETSIENFVTGYLANWKRRYLAQIKDSLTTVEKEEFGALIDEIKPEDSEVRKFYSTMTEWEGPTSPKTAEELDAMPFKLLIEYLALDLQLSDEFGSDSYRGLAQELSRAVTMNPERFARSALEFDTPSLKVVYLNAIFTGLTEAIKQNLTFSWEQPLNLAKRIVERRQQESVVEDSEQGLRGICERIAEFISEGLTSDTISIPLSYRVVVWEILQSLTGDVDPDANREHEEADHLTLSINSVRGKAGHAAFRFGLWVKRNIGETFRGFDDLPEVEGFLEYHIHQTSPSPTVRVVIGKWLPWLEVLDRGWLIRKLQNILPKGQGSERLYKACWNTYLLWNSPYNNIFEIIQSEYSYSLKTFSFQEDSKQTYTPERRWIEHIMLYYVRGLTPLGDSLIDEFYKIAPIKFRKYVIEFLGRTLRDNEALEEPFLTRLTQLIDKRLAKADDFSEFEEFGWWFASKSFDVDWKLSVLLQILPWLKKMQSHRFVLNELERLANPKPSEVLRALKYLAEMQSEFAANYSLKESAKKILPIIFNLQDSKVHNQAIELTHYLGSKGHWELRELLKQ
jgi:hypothetical protein